MKNLAEHKLFMLILFLTLSSLTFSQENSTSSQKQLKIIVMPFVEMEYYPYRIDLIREAFQLGFLQEGYNLIEDDLIWSKILEKEYNLANLSNDMVDTLSTLIDVDFIVYGRVTNFSNVRSNGLYTYQNVYKPILFKVYDTKNKTITLHERINFNENWGLFGKTNSLNEIGVIMARKLRQITH